MASSHRLLLPILVAACLDSCVYGPPRYYDPPLPYPPGYLEARPYYGDRYHSRHYRHGYRGDYLYDGFPSERAVDAVPGDRYKPEVREPYIPPAKIDVPAPGRDGSASSGVDPGDIPTATKTGKPGRVKVPFPPYSELDVSGMPSGSLARDPTSGKVFRLP